jgi:hypothetical protein
VESLQLSRPHTLQDKLSVICACVLLLLPAFPPSAAAAALTRQIAHPPRQASRSCTSDESLNLSPTHYHHHFNHLTDRTALNYLASINLVVAITTTRLSPAHTTHDTRHTKPSGREPSLHTLRLCATASHAHNSILISLDHTRP